MKMTVKTMQISLPLLLLAALGVGQVTPAPDGPKQEESVRPGINERFLDPELKVEDFVARWEVESREVYTERERVLELCGVRKGMRVADVGSGTGLYTRIFAEAVGDEGWVYAVDIAPRFLEHIRSWSRNENVDHVSAVLCRDNSIDLPPESVDVVFLCDTYHHFEYPISSSTSILRALKPGGSLVVVDFERIPGVSREWILGHVRAGKDVVKREILSAGFTFRDEVKVPGFKENYLLRFTKG